MRKARVVGRDEERSNHGETKAQTATGRRCAGPTRRRPPMWRRRKESRNELYRRSCEGGVFLEKQIIVSHVSPDWDAITSLWLLQRFGGFATAAIELVNTGKPDPEILAGAAVVVDTGR